MKSKIVTLLSPTMGRIILCIFFYICYRYFEALVSNMSFVKYKEVYAAAAEVLGLILQYFTERENVSVCGSVN